MHSADNNATDMHYEKQKNKIHTDKNKLEMHGKV